MALSKEEILDAISEMSVMDVVDLVKMMEDKFEFRLRHCSSRCTSR